MTPRLATAWLALVGTLLATALVVAGQPGTKVYRLGVLARDASAIPPTFHQALRDLGYIEGRNLVIDARYHGGRLDRLPALAAELVSAKADILLAPTSTDVRAAREATAHIPIVFTVHYDPVSTGDVVSLNHPGGNVTGLTQMGTDITAKQLELLREAVPGLRRLAIVWNPTTPSHKPSLPLATEAGRRLGIDMQVLEASSPGDFARVYTTAARARADGVLILASPAAALARENLAALTVQYRLPTMLGVKAYVEAGGLMSYQADLTENYRRAAVYVDRILKGANPADLPVEQPTQFELVINARTARAIGLTLPPSLLLRADQVIQ